MSRESWDWEGMFWKIWIREKERSQCSHENPGKPSKPCLYWVCVTQADTGPGHKGQTACLACSKPHVWALRTALKMKKRRENKSKMAKAFFPVLAMVCVSHSFKTSYRNLLTPWLRFGAMMLSAFLLNTNMRELRTHSTRYKSKMSSDPPRGSVIWIQVRNFTSQFSTVYSFWHTKLWS